MDLKSFVKTALNDVMDAVQETIEERKAAGTQVLRCSQSSSVKKLVRAS